MRNGTLRESLKIFLKIHPIKVQDQEIISQHFFLIQEHNESFFVQVHVTIHFHIFYKYFYATKMKERNLEANWQRPCGVMIMLMSYRNRL
ncbi:hypothetical protein AXX17_AT3G35670 [Arabidopsis thaliana]|uniref:Uncharacterized protein n=1 Tax=Arabidopsis thaliana TaxID=3702 RepID=A0A178VAV4_ARATH|nr:hypothetical protein AXX17_AT3G35670 [Arabidopsis thaliana]